MTKTFIAVATLLGTIIGAGILGIPYVVMQSGFSIGLAYIVVLAFSLTLISLYLGEITLRTKTTHQLTGYASIYLGKKGKWTMFFATAFGIFSALVAYILGESESLASIINFAHSSIYLGIFFWLVVSAISYFGLKALEEGEQVGVFLVISLLIIIIIFSADKINLENLNYVSYKNIFAPFGVILFAFLGFSAIPEIKRILEKRKRCLKKSIIIAYIIAFVVYALFTFVVLGTNGKNTPQLATLALGKPFILLGMLTMFTAYLALSYAMINTIRFDLKVSRNKSWIIVSTIPVLIFLALNLLKIATFTSVLSVGGIISGGVTGILILETIKKAKQEGNRRPEYSMPYSKIIVIILAALFIFGGIIEILKFI